MMFNDEFLDDPPKKMSFASWLKNKTKRHYKVLFEIMFLSDMSPGTKEFEKEKERIENPVNLKKQQAR